MIYSLLKKKVAQWSRSADCPVKRQLDYMRSAGFLRPVQIDAIETYLFLKIASGNLPLGELFSSGALNETAPDDLRVSKGVRDYLAANPASLALLELASQRVGAGQAIFAPAIKARLETAPEDIDAKAVFRSFFYGVNYPDYLFSLPMGAGKTFLMAALICLDLAFAMEEPDNPVFAHNFIVLSPSGLKSSIIPSLRTIQAFNPQWVVPDPLATQLKRQMNFMVLDADSSAGKSNIVCNPNAQKLAALQPYEDLLGLVAVTNAEKVILDRYDPEEVPNPLLPLSPDAKALFANELRETIAKIPSLSVFVDEAHHAAATEIKLRSVISRWAAKGNVNTVLGFSGTPYLASAERVRVEEGLECKMTEIANTVHYYPLVDGVGTFLKKPVVQIVRDAPDSLSIVKRGMEGFFQRFQEKRYANGTVAKLAIYCGSIARLEEEIYPLAAQMCEELGIDPAGAILRYHRGNKQHPAPADAELSFAMLDSEHSVVRIVLLVQIGKEGWDCRSLAGVILSQEGDCPTNMVLQTSCRCLREIERGVGEEALIVLNEKNGKLLADQLKKQQHATLEEFQRGADAMEEIQRFDRTQTLNLPNLPFWQMRVEYGAEIIEDGETAAERLKKLLDELPQLRRQTNVQTGSFVNLREGGVENVAAEKRPSAYCPFANWLDLLQKESFDFWRRRDLSEKETGLLRAVHEKISVVDDAGGTFLSPEYDQQTLRSRVLVAFWPRRRLSVKEETVPETARLLKVERLISPLSVMPEDVGNFVPEQNECQQIIAADASGQEAMAAIAKVQRQLAEAEAEGDADDVEFFRAKLAKAETGRGAKDKTYHYLPYRTDSGFERKFLDEILHRSEFLERDLEVYYNGESSLTEFRIRCYRKKEACGWTFVGDYTPDFLVIRRGNPENAIESCLVVETKGRLFAEDPAFQHRREFAAGQFLAQNGPRPGFPRFQYLYLEEGMPWQDMLVDAIKDFFEVRINK